MSTTGESGTVEIKRGVRLVKKVKKEKKVEQTEKKSVKENGNTNAEAELTVILPAKKPGGKTHTEVNTIKKILPDGVVEEVKTITTTTTIDGKTEVSTKTETRKLPKDEAEEAIQQAKEQEKTEKCETVVENGESNTDTELVVKLPTKKTSARTETKVAIENKILSNGTVEETKTTTTTTTIDGKSEVTTKVDKRILSKEEADAVIEVEEEEEEVEDAEKESQNQNGEVDINENIIDESEKDNKSILIKNEERSESSTTKKVVIIQESKDEQESESEDIEEEPIEEPVQEEKEELEANVPTKQDSVDEVEIVEEDKKNEKENKLKHDQEKKENIEEVEVTEEVEEEELEEEEEEIEEHEKKETVIQETDEEPEADEKEDVQEQEVEEDKEEIEVQYQKNIDTEPEKEEEESEYTEEEDESSHDEPPISAKGSQETEKENKVEKEIISHKFSSEPEHKKEPSVPLEKVEDIEIKPITSFTKANTDNTEIVVSHEKPTGPLSTQTEFNRYENIVTVNRTTKRLDHEYEQMTQQQSVPTMKTYFAPSRDRVSISPSRAYQPTYPTQSETERRHSLLLERLSTERQMPADIYQNYQYNTQTEKEHQQWSQQEPQSEVLTVSNVKPSSISKNQQWYQQSNRENEIYNNVTPTTPTPTQTWNQPQTPQSQQQHQPQYQYQPSYAENTQNFSKSTINSYQSYTPQPVSQPSYTPQASLQPNYTTQQSSQPNFTPQHSSQPSYTPQPSFTSSPQVYPPQFSSQPYSFTKQDTNDSYQKTQQYSSSYVPPPWEQDSSYVPANTAQCFYQPSTPTTFAPSSNKPWQPTTPTNKSSKPAPTAFIPPAPNQSFVKTSKIEESTKIPGRRTYYSEYERRYISVPESTYVPAEAKNQAQPDPSPKFYYDNSEPLEPVEHQWRKELREFTEKTSQTEYQTEQVVRPPWEEDPKYVKTSLATNTQTPSWSQTLRPRSWRERSFDAEYVGTQEWPKSQSNTLGRGRPVSSYVPNKVEPPYSGRARGVSVDRYNPNNYQSPIPSEHPPVQSHTLTPTNAPQKNYHNPNVPAYHARASAEQREQPGSYHQTRVWSESRASPIQSRSFKYLQWITGTDN